MDTQQSQFNGTLSNPGITRLTIGVTGRDGKRAALEFKAESTAAPLVAVIGGIETDGSDDAPPTERDLDELYLRCAGWQPVRVDGLPDLWECPVIGGAYAFADALARQDVREEQDARADLAERSATFGPQEPPQDERIFNRRQPDGTFRPLSEFFCGGE